MYSSYSNYTTSGDIVLAVTAWATWGEVTTQWRYLFLVMQLAVMQARNMTSCAYTLCI